MIAAQMPTSPKPPNRILIIRPSALGDVCRSVPVLVSLRRAYPTARIDWLVQDTFAEAIANHPDLSGVIPFPRARFSGLWKPWVLADAARWVWAIRREGYDMVIDCQGLARSGMIAGCSGAARRIGYADAKELAWLALNERVDAPVSMHTVDRMLALSETAGADVVRDMRLYPSPEAFEAVRRDPALPAGRYAVLAPTSRWPGKLWPGQAFADAGARLLAHPAIDALVLVGADNERPQCGPLLDLAAREPRVIDRIGRTSIGELMAVVGDAVLLIANDSAALHIAVGMDTPTVALYGPTDVGRVGPYRRDADVLQHLRAGDRLDHKDRHAGESIMQRITVDEVLERAHRMLDQTFNTPRAAHQEA